MKLHERTDVLVVGAGPVGLYAALALTERGLDVQVVDKEWRGAVHSYALALHPESLRLLDEYGAADDLIRQGHRVERVVLYQGASRTAVLDFSKLGGPFPYLTVVPQSALEQALLKRLQRSRRDVLWNHQAQSVREIGDAVLTRVARLEKHSMGYPIAHTEWVVEKEIEVRSRFLVGADGYHSFVRRAGGFRFEEAGETKTFAVFEFPSQIDLQHEVRVVFHAGTTNVVWPLGERRARFSFELQGAEPSAPDAGDFRRLLAERAPWFEHPSDEIHWAATAIFERRLVDRFGRGRVWLAGDAAHTTGPVGVQSMNVGLREARDLAERISALSKAGGDVSALEQYELERQREWRRLLGPKLRPIPPATASIWTDRADQLVASIPASGAELEALLGQLGVILT